LSKLKFVDKFGKLKSRDGLLIKYKHLLNLPIPARVTGFCLVAMA